MNTVIINSLDFQQAVKWIWLHERERHLQDIDSIERDLSLLEDVTIPPEAEALAGKIRFEIEREKTDIDKFILLTNPEYAIFVDE